MMIKHLLLTSFCLAGMSAMAQTTLATARLKSMLSKQTFTETSVHDPSIVTTSTTSGTTYYVYGSHLGVSKSTDLMNWTSGVGGGETSSCTLFADVNGNTVGYANAYSTQAVKQVKNYKGETVDFPNFDAHGWQYKGNTVAGMEWAPDVIYNKTMKKWCMYMSLNGDYWCSSIVCFTSDNVEGPWVYQGPVVMSGFSGRFDHNSYAKSNDWQNTDLAIATGATALPDRYNVTTNANWGNYWPNCIDPCVFYDDNDNLWMSYGSWSGGIYIIRLDKENGLRDYTYTFPYEVNGTAATPGIYNQACTSDPYFGKKIAGGYYVSGEGSYIKKIGNYYYLFLSYGGLNPTEGYEMRIFRSTSPDGPYTDASGNSARYTSYVLNYGPNSKTNKGMRILGSMNNWGTMTTGECAQGHNSAMVDEGGDAYVIYHTKFHDGTYGHQVRTHQLFVNEKGYLVAAPFRYTGKQTKQSTIESQQLFTATEIAGDYKLIIHPYKLDHKNYGEATPVSVTLSADGKIRGDVTGSWKYSEDGKSFVTLVVSGTTYYGVVTKQKVDGYHDMPAIAFTAVASSGVPVWLYKYQDDAAVAANYDLVNDYLSQKLTDNAPNALYGATVKYACYSDAARTVTDNTLSEDGTYTPTSDGGTRYVTVTITCGNYTYSGNYTVSTARAGETVIPVYYPESTTKDLTAGWWTNFSTKNYTLNAGESAQFKFYNYSNAANNWENWCLYGASTTHGASGYTEYFGIRNDNWNNTTSSNTGCTSDFNWNTFLSDMNGSLVDITVTYTTEGLFTMTSTIKTTSGKEYNYSYTTTISTKPSNITLFFVNEKSYIDGSSIATGINKITNDRRKANMDGAMYNLSGQRVNDSYKGIVIVNGKKYLNK